MSGLEGIRILDLSRYAPGPFCTLILAALGAEVIKVEAKPDGDPLRALDPEAFERLNAGKKSILLDLKRGEGRRALRRIARNADILVEGFRPGVMERFGLDYESLKSEAPRLVYLSLTGYGGEGPYRDRAGPVPSAGPSAFRSGSRHQLRLNLAEPLPRQHDLGLPHVDTDESAAVRYRGLPSRPASAVRVERNAARRADTQRAELGQLEPKRSFVFVVQPVGHVPPPNLNCCQGP